MISTPTTTKRIMVLFLAFCGLVSCSSEFTVDQDLLVSSFQENIGTYEEAIITLKIAARGHSRLEIYPDSDLATADRLAKLYDISRYPVQKVIVYGMNDPFLAEFYILAEGVMVGGQSWSILYHAAPVNTNDPAIRSLSRCKDHNLKSLVDAEVSVLGAECRLSDNWLLRYSSN